MQTLIFFLTFRKFCYKVVVWPVPSPVSVLCSLQERDHCGIIGKGGASGLGHIAGELTFLS